MTASIFEVTATSPTKFVSSTIAVGEEDCHDLIEVLKNHRCTNVFATDITSSLLDDTFKSNTTWDSPDNKRRIAETVQRYEQNNPGSVSDEINKWADEIILSTPRS